MLFGYLEHSAEGGQRERREEWATFILGKTLIGCHSPASRQCIHCTGNSKLGIVVHPASWKWSENFVASRLNEHAGKLFQNSIELKVKEKFKNCFKNFRDNFWPTNGPLKYFLALQSGYEKLLHCLTSTILISFTRTFFVHLADPSSPNFERMKDVPILGRRA